jgi:hypothetical protein
MRSTHTTPARRGRRGLAAAVVGLAAVAVLPASAPAHGTSVASMSTAEETRLYRAERAILGPAHASEHRSQRAAMRDPRVRARVRREARRAAARSARRRARKADASLGAWNSTPFNLDVMGIHAAMLPTGKVMFFSYPTNPSKGDEVKKHEGLAVLWDPVTNRQVRKDPPINTDALGPNSQKTINIWCAGQSFLANGHLLVTGGNYDYQGGTRSFFRGLKTVLTFDPWTERWTRHPDMKQGRWYPSQTLQPDGRTLITSGLADDGVDTGTDTPLNKDVEVFTPPATPGAQGTTRLATGPGHDLKGLYPHQWVMPSGKTLVAGPYQQDSFYLTLVAGSDTYRSEPVPNLNEQRYWASGVLMPGGPDGSRQVMLTGGATRGSSNSHKASTTTWSEGNGAWSAGASMQQPRAHHNTVLLPDGSMVSVGGGYGATEGDQWTFADGHRSVDLWDPATNAWRRGPQQVEQRTYHSTAILLPDGRVISAGDDDFGGQDKDTAQIYSPPYMFKGQRPVIDAAPTEIGWGTTFAVNAHAAAGEVTKAVLVAPGAVTHANDMNQRLIEMRLAPAGAGRVNLVAPADGNIAPPGWYMLFALDANDVPSVAKWVHLTGGLSDPDPAAPSPGASGNPGATTPSPRSSRPRSSARRSFALGTFERRSISPWRARSRKVTLTRTAHGGRYALALTASGRRAAVAERRVSGVARGTYTLELWMRGRELGVQASGARARTFKPRSSRRWSRVAVRVRMTRTGTVVVRLMGRGRTPVRVDDVTLKRL